MSETEEACESSLVESAEPAPMYLSSAAATSLSKGEIAPYLRFGKGSMTAPQFGDVCCFTADRVPSWSLFIVISVGSDCLRVIFPRMQLFYEGRLLLRYDYNQRVGLRKDTGTESTLTVDDQTFEQLLPKCTVVLGGDAHRTGSFADSSPRPQCTCPDGGYLNDGPCQCRAVTAWLKAAHLTFQEVTDDYLYTIETIPRSPQSSYIYYWNVSKEELGGYLDAPPLC